MLRNLAILAGGLIVTIAGVGWCLIRIASEVVEPPRPPAKPVDPDALRIAPPCEHGEILYEALFPCEVTVGQDGEPLGMLTLMPGDRVYLPDHCQGPHPDDSEALIRVEAVA